MNPLLQNFLKSRKSEATKEYVQRILENLLLDKFERSGELVERLVPDQIPNTSTFYKLLSDLEKSYLIERCLGKKEKHKRGSRPVYYKLKTPVSEIDFWDRKRLEEEYLKLKGGA